MANPLRGEVDVEVSDGAIRFRPTFDRIVRFETESQLRLMDVADRHDRGNLSTIDQINFLAAMRDEESDESPEAMGARIFEAGGMNLVRAAVFQVLTMAVTGGLKPDAKQKKTEPQSKRATKSTGNGSAKSHLAH